MPSKSTVRRSRPTAILRYRAIASRGKSIEAFYEVCNPKTDSKWVNRAGAWENKKRTAWGLTVGRLEPKAYIDGAWYKNYGLSIRCIKDQDATEN